MKPETSFVVGIGPTPDFCLRVSIASLVRVLFKTSHENEWWLALERKVTLVEKENSVTVEVNAQPFGGAVNILALQELHNRIGGFRFDSERSRAEADFRLFIQPSQWPTLQAFLIENLNRPTDIILETSPDRELVEEFEDAVDIALAPNQYISKPISIVLEENPSPTENNRARGHPTVRVYRIYETIITDVTLAEMISTGSHQFSDKDLSTLAIQRSRNGGQGRANGILALPLEELVAFYTGLPFQDRISTVLFQGHRLSETVAAVLEGIATPKHRKL